MKNKISKELFLQIIILIACIMTLITTQSKIFVQAQCLGPEFNNSTPSFAIAWSPNIDVIVKIDDRYNPAEISAIKTGLDGWEGNVPAQTCSNVTFKDPVTRTFDPAKIEDEESYPPITDPSTTYVVKVVTSGTLVFSQV